MSGELRVARLELRHVADALRRVQNLAAEAFYDAEESTFIVGRSPITDTLEDMASSEFPSWFLPETSERLVEVGVRGRFRGARVVRSVGYRDAPAIRVQDLHVLVAKDRTALVDAVMAQRQSGAAMNRLVMEDSFRVTIIDQSVLEFVGGDGL